jgi:hypothetical protein
MCPLAQHMGIGGRPKLKNSLLKQGVQFSALGGIRTPNLLIRSQML